MKDVKWKAAGDFLRKKRKETQLSVFKVSRAVGISGNYLSLIERGMQKPSDQIIYNLAKFYKIGGLDLFDLYGRCYCSEIRKRLIPSPSLKQALLRLTTDKSLTPDMKQEIGVRLNEIIDEVVSKNQTL